MTRSSLAFAVAAACVSGTILIANTADRVHEERDVDPPMAGIHWARDARPTSTSNVSPDLNYHGGPVMHGMLVEPIFWGPSWANATFVGDKVTGLQTFYSGIASSTYAATTGEYSDSTGPVNTAAVTLGGSVFEYSTAANGSRTSAILARACTAVPNPVSNGYYPVYVDTRRGHANYCAWHSAGTCRNGVTIQFAFFFNVDGDPGCDPQDASGLHSQGLAALANVSGHELSETLTDRHLNAWYDSNGQENADKCAWSFGTPLLTFPNGSEWKIQGNWSNRAANTSAGYPNLNGQPGCLDGGNYR